MHTKKASFACTKQMNTNNVAICLALALNNNNANDFLLFYADSRQTDNRLTMQTYSLPV